MELIDCPETSVWNYHYSLRKIPEERGSHVPRWVVQQEWTIL